MGSASHSNRAIIAIAPVGSLMSRDARTMASIPAIPADPNVSRQTSGASPVNSVSNLDDHPPEAEQGR